MTWKALTKQTKWVLYLVVAVIVGFGFAMVAPFLSGRKRGGGEGLPRLPEAMQRKLDQVHEEALAAKVEAKVKADSDRIELAAIGDIEDGRERRRQLAEKLKQL